MKKQLTKEDLPVGTKVVPHAKTTGGSFDSCFYWGEIVRDSRDFLYVIDHLDNRLVLSSSKNARHGSLYNYSDVTIYKPKVKRSEIIERLEKLESIVEDLTRPVELVHQEQAPTVSFDMALGKDFTVISRNEINKAIDVEKLLVAEKFHKEEMKNLGYSWLPDFVWPVAKVGNFYKTSGDIMFCCTKVEGRKIFGFGFGDKGVWREDGNLFAEGQQYLMLSPASSEEWKEAVTKRAYDMEYHKLVKDFIRFEFQSNHSVLVIVAGTPDNQCYIPIMSKGRWLFKSVLDWRNEK